ncbi:MAG: hypothetical protein F4X44_08855 [Gammaproteobacteria bacterium]|nr:hypothetical protein [Gammaproteobacteria bacterium]MYD80707.1 hypothetical protein [Gammaproteobacteria bacterium]
MGRYRHGGFRSELDLTNQRRHQAKALLLLEQQSGIAAATREFDIAELKDEIEIVLQGGELSLPDSMGNILQEIDKRQRARESANVSDETDS